MSVRKVWILRALLLLGGLGSCWYLRATRNCFEGGGGWHPLTGCYANELQPSAAPAPTPVRAPESTTGGAQPGPARAYVTPRVAVRLVDSTGWEEEDAQGTLWRIEVAAAGRIDTIPEVLTDALPVVVTDSVLFGFSFDHRQIVSGFEYRIAKRDLLTFETPENEFRGWFVHPEISPDGRFVAWWTLLDDGVGRIEIHEWPGRVLRAFSPDQTVGGGDADLGGMRWIDRDSLEYLISGEGVEYHGKGTIAGFGPMDTLRR